MPFRRHAVHGGAAGGGPALGRSISQDLMAQMRAAIEGGEFGVVDDHRASGAGAFGRATMPTRAWSVGCWARVRLARTQVAGVSLKPSRAKKDGFLVTHTGVRPRRAASACRARTRLDATCYGLWGRYL